MTKTNITHVGFSDESNWNIGRFRSLCFVSTPIAHYQLLLREIDSRLKDSDVTEFKWHKLKNAKYRFSALKLIDFVVAAATKKLLRVDVLTWDIEDSRHAVQGRDDGSNLNRMYFHLFKYVLRARWPDEAIWRLCPDEHSCLNWQTIENCLANVSTSIEIDDSFFSDPYFPYYLKRDFNIYEVAEVKSQDSPLVQVADLFAGLAAFSWEKFSEYVEWCNQNTCQTSIFDVTAEESSSSHSSVERCSVLEHFNNSCKSNKLGVSLKSKNGLWTPNPRNPLNFWKYEPQHEKDVAPQKKASVEIRL